VFLFDDVNKSHYEILGIPETAGNEEIKRAYFGMVRKYPPDRFPKEFKEIRAAYETLMDTQKRAEYDAIGGLPSSVVPLFHEAQRFDRLGRKNKAAEMYEIILKSHPELDNLRELYALSLSSDDKNGKAAEVWEELCRRQPGNAYYARELSRNYFDRGWHKKAVAEIQRSLTLDRTAIDSWTMLVSFTTTGTAHGTNVWEEINKISREAIETLKNVTTDEWKKIPLYTHLFVASGIKKIETARKYLREVIRLVRENGRNGQEGGRHALDEILLIIPPESLAGFYFEIQELAGMVLGRIDAMTRRRLNQLQQSFDTENLPQKGFDEIFRDLFRILNSDSHADMSYDEISILEEEAEILTIECILLDSPDTFNPQIRRLKEAYPGLYGLHDSFFNEALRTRNPEKMIHQRTKKISKLKRKIGIDEEDDDDEGAEEVVQTVRRDQPKVGRNDPCPCGSGKKYKRCCGR
jgi:curved DNA-binding protein CbpA